MTDKELRKRVKILKATDGIKSYREIAELMEMSNSSFYNWLNEQYNLSTDRKYILDEIINNLSIEY